MNCCSDSSDSESKVMGLRVVTGNEVRNFIDHRQIDWKLPI